MKTRNKKLLLYDLGIIILLIIVVFFAYQLISYFMQIQNSQNKIGNLKNMIAAEKTVEEGSENNNNINPKYKELYEKNNDFVGWISIEDSRIDYPVMQNVEDNEYYLHRDFDKQYDLSGLIFADNRCNIAEPMTNTILYGHNMKAGTMFAGLLKYKNKSYYESHRNIQFDTIYGERTYHVFAAFSVQVYNEEDKEFKYYAFVDMKEEEEFNTYIEQVMQKSYYQDEIPVFGDELLTLSTCESGNNDKRFVVMAKRVER